jgi:hypothetical protein
LPNRILREGILTSERINDLSPAGELFYRRLMSVVDDFGRYPANLTLLRSAVYPLKPDLYDEARISEFLEECSRGELLRVYGVSGRRYLEMIDFRQRTRAMVSKYPAPEGRTDNSAPGWHAATTRPSDDGQMTVDGPSCGSRPQAETETETYTETETNTCASGDALICESSSIDDPSFSTIEPEALFSIEEPRPAKSADGLTPQQESWFTEWWTAYWLHKARKPARKAFAKQVKTEARFLQVMTATKAQAPELLSRQPNHRPHGATWLTGERWDDETSAEVKRDAGEDAITKLIYGDNEK